MRRDGKRKSPLLRAEAPLAGSVLVALAVAAAVAALALAVAHSAGGGSLLLWEGAREIFGTRRALKGFVLGFGVWAPVALFVAQAAQVVLAPIPGAVTAVVGVLLFGPWVGTALGFAGGMAGSVVLFALVRRWGRPLAAGLVGRKRYERYAGALDDEKGALLLIVMLVPFVPDDVAVAAAGLSAVSFRRFVAVVALGRLPGSAVTALVAADLLGRSAGTLAMVALLLVVAAALLFPHRKRLEARLLRLAPRRWCASRGLEVGRGPSGLPPRGASDGPPAP